MSDEYTIAMVDNNDDFYIIVGKYCEKCEDQRYGVLKSWKTSKSEATEWARLKTKCKRAKCSCHGKEEDEH